MKQTDATFVPNALKLTEQSVHLLRRNSLNALTAYYVGSLPFIFGLLYFWSDMSRNPYAHHYCSPAAAGLALAFIWMKYWHVRYCRHLWHALNDTEPEKQGVAKEMGVMMRQAFLQATGFIVLPISMIILLPLAWTYAFYQNASVMESPHASDLKTVYLKAKNQSVLWPGQNHLILCIMCFFTSIVFFNISTVMMFLPYVLKKLIGLETVFTISGIHAMANTTFFAIACALTYLCVDPIIKAVYTLRCFYSESRSTGDDIRINLKPYLKISVMMAAFLIAAMFPIFNGLAQEKEMAASLVPLEETTAYADELDQSIERVLQSPEFAWRMPREKIEVEEEEEDGWFTAAVRWFFKQLGNVFQAIREWIGSIIDWFKDLFPEREYEPGDNQTLGLVIRIVFYILAAALIVFLIVLLQRYIKSMAFDKSRLSESEERITDIDLDDENVTANDLPYDRWLSLARDSIEKKDLRQALRALYLAILAQLGDTHRIDIARYKSNRDYLVELSSHAHAEQELFGLFETCMKMFERFWYGMHPVALDTLNLFKSNQERISALVQQQ